MPLKCSISKAVQSQLPAGKFFNLIKIESKTSSQFGKVEHCGVLVHIHPFSEEYLHTALSTKELQVGYYTC